MTVSELLAKTSVRDVICIDAQAKFLEAAKRLREHNIGSLLVTDNLGQAIGIVTERDLVNHIAQSSTKLDNPILSQIMSADLITCSPNDDVVDTFQKMNENHIRHMLVVDEQKPVSMLSIREFEYACKVLQQEARTDELTGLHNRRFFMELLDKEFSKSQRFGSALSVAMIDIDKFKEINDSFGHLGGDKVLNALAKLMIGKLRTYDIVGRLGGEEFAIAFPNTSINDAQLACCRLMSAIRTHDVETEDGNIMFTASFGLVDAVGNYENSNMLLNEADRLLYKAKHAGRNRLIVGSEKSAFSEVESAQIGS